MLNWKDDESVNALGENVARQVLELEASHQLLVAKADRMVAILLSFIIGVIILLFNYTAYFSNDKGKSNGLVGALIVVFLTMD